MGLQLRHYRKEMKITISELAAATGLSIGYISQVERGLVEPSISSLRKIADALDVSMISLLEEQRASDFMTIRSGDQLTLRNKEDTVLYELLTPLPSEDFRPKSLIIKFTLQPRAQVSEGNIHHPSEEMVTILEGEMVLCVGERETVLYPGDTSVIRKDLPHNFRNDTDKPMMGISCLTPPVWGKNIR